MDNYKKENFQDNWTPLGAPVYKSFKDSVDEIDDSSEVVQEGVISKNNRKRYFTVSSVVSLQLVICLLVLIVSYLCSTFFAEKFQIIKEVYDDEIYASMLFDGNLEDVDYSMLFSFKENE